MQDTPHTQAAAVTGWTTGPAQDLPAVHERINALDQAAGDLAGVVAALIDRLGPVLRPQSPIVLEAATTIAASIRSPLADRVENLRAGLADTHERLVRTLDALEV